MCILRDFVFPLPRLLAGIPRLRAGEIWVFLRSHMERRSASILQPCPKYEPYSDLIKQLTTHQHAILIDLGKAHINIRIVNR